MFVVSGCDALSSFLHLKQKPECTIFNAPKLETTKMPINTLMDRYIVVYSPKGLLCSNENECTITTYNNVDITHKYNVELRKPVTKEYMLGIPFL